MVTTDHGFPEYIQRTYGGQWSVLRNRSLFKGVFKIDYTADIGVLVLKDQNPSACRPFLPTPTPTPVPRRRGLIARREIVKAAPPPPDPVVVTSASAREAYVVPKD
jgi:hypothetical protein